MGRHQTKDVNFDPMDELKLGERFAHGHHLLHSGFVGRDHLGISKNADTYDQRPCSFAMLDLRFALGKVHPDAHGRRQAQLLAKLQISNRKAKFA